MGVKVQIDSALSEILPTKTCFLLGTSDPPRILYMTPFLPTPPETSSQSWTTEHARTLHAMCPGGVSLLGTYAPSGERNTSMSSKNVDLMALLVRRIAATLDLPAFQFVLTTALKGRLAVKQVAHDEDGVRAADLRVVSNLADRAVRLQGQVALKNIVVPLATEHNDQSIKKAEQTCVARAEQLASLAVVSISKSEKVHILTDVTDERSLAEVMTWPIPSGSKKKSQVSVIPPVDVDIHLPFGEPVTDEDDDGKGDGNKKETSQTPQTSISLSGYMFVQAVVTQDSSIAEVLHAIRGDVKRSLQTRMQLLCEGDELEEDPDEMSTPGSRSFPVRVVASSKAPRPRHIPFTEFISAGEDMNDVKARIAEVLAWSESDMSDASVERKELVGKVHAAEKSDAVVPPLKAEDIDACSELDDDDEMEGPPPLLVNGVLLAIILTVIAIVVKQIL